MTLTRFHTFKLYTTTHTCTRCNAVIRKKTSLPGALIRRNLTHLLCSASDAGPCPKGCDTTVGTWNLCIKLSIDEQYMRHHWLTPIYAAFLSLKYLKYIYKPG